VPLHRFGSRHCRHLGLTVSSASSRFFHPNFLCSSLPLCLPVLQALATTSADHRSSSPTPGMSLSHCAAASVCPRRHHLARRSPFSCLSYPHQCLHTLSPGWMPTVAPPRGVPCAVTTLCVHRAASIDRLGRPFGLGPPCGVGHHAH
jgi:hypothetical protein